MSGQAHATTHTHDHDHDEPHNDIVYPAAIPFVLVHLACFLAIWTGVTSTALVICAVLYVVRMWALTAGYHRYFSHRSYKTSRVFQFLLAFLGETSAQRGVIWWSAVHRHHHRHSDTPEDVHSPRHAGFLFSHVGWIFSRKKGKADYSTVPDLTRYRELVWLDRHHYVPATVLAVACFLVAGWPGLVVGFFWSTTILYHCTFFINSLAHVVGNQRYVTGDDSRNNWWLAIITLGEGWHNNHHHYQSSTRQGFRWWEIDVSYYVLKLMSFVRLVWDLRAPPAEVVQGEKRLGRKVIEKVARELAESFQVDRIADQVRDAWSHTPSYEDLKRRAEAKRAELQARLDELQLPHFPSLDELRRRAGEKSSQIQAFLGELQLPDVPSLDELRERAREMYRDTPSLDEIAERARELILEALSVRLLSEEGLATG